MDQIFYTERTSRSASATRLEPKNVVAIATGVAQGLGAGDNTRAAVISRGLSPKAPYYQAGHEREPG
jgi:NAD-dependent glycerol-3-phosphate dehydrogenase C-terminus